MKSWKSETDDREKYGLYLASREWSVLKEAVHARAKGVCERCNVNKIDAVHHLTYIRKYQEQLDDLQGLCNPCHQFIHGKSDNDPAKPKVGFHRWEWICWLTLGDRGFRNYEVLPKTAHVESYEFEYPPISGLVHPPEDQYDCHVAFPHPVRLSSSWPNPLYCSKLDLGGPTPTGWMLEEKPDKTLYLLLITEDEVKTLCSDPVIYANAVYNLGFASGVGVHIWGYMHEFYMLLPAIKAFIESTSTVAAVDIEGTIVEHALSEIDRYAIKPPPAKS